MNVAIRTPWRGYVYALISAVLWGSAFVATRVGLTGLSPTALAFWRYVVASATVLPFYLASHHTPLPSGRGLAALLGAGMVGIGAYNLLLNTAQLVVDAAISSFIVSQIPVFTVLLAWYVLDEPLNRKGLLSLLVSIVGITLVACNTHPAHHTSHTLPLWLGLMALLGAALAGATYSVMLKPLLKRFDPLQLTALMVWSGTLILLPFGWHGVAALGHAHSASRMAMIYLGVFPGCLAYVAWSRALYHLPACQASSMLYTMPLITLGMSHVLLHEVPATMALVGGVIAVLGACMMNMWAQPAFKRSLRR